MPVLASEPRRYSTEEPSGIRISLSSSGGLNREISKDCNGFAVFA